jgi:alkylation response protein AidB-like acyl-CoA dehydrogenase
MIDFELTDEQKEIKELAHRFAEKELRPVVLDLERVSDQSKRFPWEVMEKASKIGLRTYAVPEKYGGLGASPLSRCLVLEEIGAVDAGVALALDITWRYCSLIGKLGTKEQADSFFPDFMKDDRYLLGAAFTEPSHGSDFILGTEGNFETTARLENNQWVLRGIKHFISNVLEAKLFVVFAATDPSKTFLTGSSCFLVPRDTVGLRIGAVHKKMAFRLSSQGEIILDECRIPKSSLLGSVNKGMSQLHEYSREFDVEHAAFSLGVARGAVEEAYKFAQERIQGGKPIIEHQAIGMMLADIYSRLEAARLVILKAAWAVENQKPYDDRLGPISKYYVAEEALVICEKAFEIFGCYGLQEDLPIQKYVRDALGGLPQGGTQQATLIKLLRRMRERGNLN